MTSSGIFITSFLYSSLHLLWRGGRMPSSLRARARVRDAGLGLCKGASHACIFSICCMYFYDVLDSSLSFSGNEIWGLKAGGKELVRPPPPWPFLGRDRMPHEGHGDNQRPRVVTVEAVRNTRF